MTTQNHSAGVPARVAAARALAAVLDKKTDLDQALHLAFKDGSFAPRDRAFVHMLVGSVLRHLPQLDELIASYMARGQAVSPPMLAHVLRLGMAQVLLAGVPHHAAVSATVDAAAALRLERQKNLVNALLRRAGREAAFALPEQDALAHFPEWMTQGWAGNFGPERAAAIAAASLVQAPVDLCLRDEAQTDHWCAALGGTSFMPGHVRLPDDSAPIPELAGYAEGAWWVQDFAASLPVRLLGDVTGLRVLDICAAPGGKTMQLAARGAKVTALDRSARRLDVLKRNMARTGLEADIVVADATTWQPEEAFDAILLDAPCSATGTLRRHPELPYLRTQADMESLVQLQTQLLDHAPSLLETGGRLVYCTCSLQPEEGEMHQQGFMSRHKGFKSYDAGSGSLGNLLESNISSGTLRLAPDLRHDQGGMDGFFAFAVQKS